MALSHANPKVHTIQEAMAIFNKTLTDLLGKQNRDALLTKEFLKEIQEFIDRKDKYVHRRSNKLAELMGVRRGKQATNAEFSPARQVLIFLDDLFNHLAAGKDGFSSSVDLNSFVERFNKLTIFQEAELLQLSRDSRYPIRKGHMRIGVALSAVVLAVMFVSFILAALCLPALSVPVLFLAAAAMLGSVIGLAAATGLMIGSYQSNELSSREKTLNTNISLLGKVKGTLFGLPSESSETKLVDGPLKDLPEPIESKPLLFTCC